MTKSLEYNKFVTTQISFPIAAELAAIGKTENKIGVIPVKTGIHCVFSQGLLKQSSQFKRIPELLQNIFQYILCFTLIFSLTACSDFANIFKKGSSTSHSQKKSKAKEIAPNRKGKKGKVLPGYFDWPLKAEVSSKFGERWGRNHDGIDIRSPNGTPFKAAASGKVFYAGKFSGYGNLILIKHSNNYVTGYAHCSKMKVKDGDEVSKGEVIGEVGNTGHTTGYNLHFEIRYETTPMDPLKFLP